MAKITIEETATDPDAPTAGQATVFVRASDSSVRVRDSSGAIRQLDTGGGNVESLSTEGAVDTVPTSDGAGNLTMQVPGTAALAAHAADGDAHHAEEHTVASHSDTDATGAQLDALVGGADTALHTHVIESQSAASTNQLAVFRPNGAGGVAAVVDGMESLTFLAKGPLAVQDFIQLHRWGFAGVIREVHVVALEAITAGDFTFRVRSGADHTAFVGGDLVTTLTLDFATQDTEISATGLNHAFSAGDKCAPDVTVATGTQPSSDERAAAMIVVMYTRG